MKQLIVNLARQDEGASAVEYAVLIAMIIAICIAVIAAIGTKTNGLYEILNTTFK
jgi:pilus assembly protein Flp/PilA